MYKHAKQGWLKLVNPQKFIKPKDSYMKSFNESTMSIEYKSSLEKMAFQYADYNKHIVKFSVEPFHIKYVKPTDGKLHRYFLDMYLEFSSGQKFLVEIKSKSETKPPRKPGKKTEKALRNYQKALMTYAVNSAKWKEAEKWAKDRNMTFIIMSEDQLK